ncbi:hypothetical protein LWI28_024442 [Acer negundo]|uniref:histidine kinase n=1 Tax=Acer negundo TaxID=4023 RepID=A0AAD5J7T6_ACENE|nr:hypothetical protein LWI28_024442 [Acer negundo]
MADVAAAAKERRIIVAVDEGEESMYALTWCLKNVISQNSNDTLILLYAKPPRAVYPTLDGTGYLFSSDIMASMEKYISDMANGVIEKAKKLCREQSGDVKVEARVGDGDPRDVICDMVEKLGADVLVMGSHGYGWIKRWGFCGFVTLKLWLMTKQTEQETLLESYGVRNHSFSEIESTARLLLPLNSSAINLARSLSSFLNGTELSFATIGDKVAPRLFLALATIPHVSQVSYIGLDGLMFTYYKDGGQTLAVYSNTSRSSFCYTQPVNRDTGMLYGEAVVFPQPMIFVNESWFQQSLNSTSSGYSSIGTKWNKPQESLFFSTVAMDGRGIISLGIPDSYVADRFAALDFHGGDFHLTSADGKVIIGTKLKDTRIMARRNSVFVTTLPKYKHNNGHHVQGSVALVSCTNDGKLSPVHGKVLGVKYIFFCSTLEVAGVHSVYVLSYSRDRLASLVSKDGRASRMLLVFMFLTVIISVGIFIFLIGRAAKREMYLCAALVKQMNATHQAERKSMNKTFALAKASHDVRASLAAITGLVEVCQDDASPQSELAENLSQIRTCTVDLLGILNSVLEMSKIEAGKMELQVEDFNLAQLLEEVVDMFYVVAIKKGVDVVLDPSDGSIMGICLVRGDRVKLKQILCNLLSNAIKFTSEGHVSVRAVVKKKSFEKEIIASNHNVISKCLSSSFFKNKGGFNGLDALHSVEQSPNVMEFDFEVDDTGKGIPKDKRNSVFEEFVQVKETSLGHEGSGLGLGIVQSMVHLMKGDITIVDKEPGERGTCFKFNVLLTICEPESTNTNEESPKMHNDWYRNRFHQHFTSFWNSAPKPEGSHMILFIVGEERRRVLKRYIENNLKIKVTIVKQEKILHQELKKLKRKMDPSYICDYSGKSDSIFMENLTKSASNNSEIVATSESNSRSLSSFTLVVIDAHVGSSSELYRILTNFKKENSACWVCKVIWLDNPFIRNAHVREHEENRLVPPCDHVINKPFHGSCLVEALKLLPECKGTSTSQCNVTSSQDVHHYIEPNPLKQLKISLETNPVTSSSQLEQIVIHSDKKGGEEKPLSGKKILVVEDNAIILKLTVTTLRKNGAYVEVCTNGKHAFDQVCKTLSDQRKEGHSKSLPYDYIMMDCEMPVMDGYEATRLIRKEEKHYSVHIPIIALTSHGIGEEASKIAEAGMDFHLTKPLKVYELLEINQTLEEKQKEI